jgi:hypothetical protein
MTEAYLNLRCLNRKPGTLTRLLHRLQERIRERYDSNTFQYLVACMIVANFILEASQLQFKPLLSEEENASFEAVDLVFTFIFLLEILCNMAANLVWKFLGSKWSLFDTTIVVVSLVSLGPTDVPFFKAMRLLRVFRIMRLFGRVPSLRQLLAALGSSIGPVMSAMSLVICVICMYAILGVNFYSNKMAGHFKTFLRGPPLSVCIHSRMNMRKHKYTTHKMPVVFCFCEGDRNIIPTANLSHTPNTQPKLNPMHRCVHNVPDSDT